MILEKGEWWVFGFGATTVKGSLLRTAREYGVKSFDGIAALLSLSCYVQAKVMLVATLEISTSKRRTGYLEGSAPRARIAIATLDPKRPYPEP